MSIYVSLLLPFHSNLNWLPHYPTLITLLYPTKTTFQLVYFSCIIIIINDNNPHASLSFLYGANIFTIYHYWNPVGGPKISQMANNTWIQYNTIHCMCAWTSQHCLPTFFAQNSFSVHSTDWIYLIKIITGWVRQSQILITKWAIMDQTIAEKSNLSLSLLHLLFLMFPLFAAFHNIALLDDYVCFHGLLKCCLHIYCLYKTGQKPIQKQNIVMRICAIDGKNWLVRQNTYLYAIFWQRQVAHMFLLTSKYWTLKVTQK